MSTKIKINHFKCDLDYKQFDEKYSLYRLETSDKYIREGSYLLDSPLLNNNIKSIKFINGKTVIIMMYKSIDNRYQLKELLSSVEQGDTFSFQECSAKELPDHILLQLLLNKMAAFDSDFLRFNNTTGHFFITNNNWLIRGTYDGKDIISQIPCLELSFEKNMLLTIKMRTFTSEHLKNYITFKKKKFEDYPKYVFGKEFTLRRKLEEDNEDSYIMRQIEGRKGHLDFLDIENISKFENTKIGVLNQVVAHFNNEYSGLAHIEFTEIEAGEYIEPKSAATSKKLNINTIETYLKKTGINIVNLIGDSSSSYLCAAISDILKEFYGISSQMCKEISNDAPNICLIHEKIHYADNFDPYYVAQSDAVVQHITYESTGWCEDPQNIKARKTLKAILMAVIYEIIIKEDIKNRKFTLFNWQSTNIDKKMTFGTEITEENIKKYIFMTINPDGTFIIKEQGQYDLELNEYSKCIDAFNYASMKKISIKGLIMDEDENINYIVDTDIITIPEAEKLKERLKSGDNKLRNRCTLNDILFSCVDIKEYKENEKQYYFAGYIGSGIRYTLNNAVNVRLIEGYENSPLMFNRLLPTLNVVYVHNGQLTVIPFPFKYLREYINSMSLQSVN